jgi:hypothetical protein
MGMVRAVGRSSDEQMPLISYLLSVHIDIVPGAGNRGHGGSSGKRQYLLKK